MSDGLLWILHLIETNNATEKDIDTFKSILRHRVSERLISGDTARITLEYVEEITRDKNPKQ
jgi:hypothetical protein